MKILVTGATGFVGKAACRTLATRGHEVFAAVRQDVALPEGVSSRPIGDLGPDTDWSAALAGMDTIIHLAARAHVMAETEADPLVVFRRINRDGAARLAEQAASAGVRRLVFVSSIKVNGEATPADRPFHAEDSLRAVDPYGIAKAEAEQELAAIAARTGLELVVVRPPLVHGPGVKGNLASLMKIVRNGVPLPLGCVDNRRSLVGLANLTDALAFVAEHEHASGRTFLIKDGEDVSTAALIRKLAAAMGRPPRLLPCPPALLRLGGRMLGRQAAMDRLIGSLVVDDSPLRALGWVPPQSLDEGLKAMVGG